MNEVKKRSTIFIRIMHIKHMKDSSVIVWTIIAFIVLVVVWYWFAM